MNRSVLVLGGGSAGFLAAITLKTRMPDLPVTVLRSKEVGIIQVGESTTTTVCYHLHHACQLDIKRFYQLAQPQWKLGIRFEWGPRPFFNYAFGPELDCRYETMPRVSGYYLDDKDAFTCSGAHSCMMNTNKAFLRQEDGSPRIVADDFAYHLENDKLVAFFEVVAKERGIRIIDDTVVEVLQDDHGVTGLRLKSGGMISAGLYIDASGFRSELLGKALREPYYSYNDALFCDRAIVGDWMRDVEPIQPYTTAETMNAGWCWRIDHEVRIHRGYVFCSSFLSDADAEAEFRAKNPKAGPTRTVAFRSGRYQRFWVKNVVAVGNAVAFVEPLESTSLACICLQSQATAEVLAHYDQAPTPSALVNFNHQMARSYDTIRDFLAIHYRFNRRLDTPFWRECLANVALHGAQRPVDFYRENGPSVRWRDILFEDGDANEFGMEGFLAMLVGQCVPYESSYKPSEADRTNWRRIQKWFKSRTEDAYTVPEALALFRSESWQWPENLYNQSRVHRR